MKKPTNGNSFVTYKWLLTTILGSAATILALVGAIANTTFYSKAAGAAVEERVEGTDKKLAEMNNMLTEVRQDIKVILARKK